MVVTLRGSAAAVFPDLRRAQSGAHIKKGYPHDGQPFENFGGGAG
ncbi:hypothetical protein [Cognatishimia sp. F0-27]|nr:hypothetical protein [Cognatishimia sp. F0-27]